MFKLINKGSSVTTVAFRGRSIVIKPGREHVFKDLTPGEIRAYSGLSILGLSLQKVKTQKAAIVRKPKDENVDTVSEDAPKGDNIEATESESSEDSSEVDYDALSKAQLFEICAEKGIETTGKETKGQLLLKLRG